MKKGLVSIIMFLLIIASISCCKDDGPPPEPLASNLVFPEEDSECTTGQEITLTESSVTFRWNAAQNADTYNLNVTSLSTNESTNFSTASTSFSVTLNKGEGYSWFVTSSSDESSKTAQSEIWRFYNSADGVESYTPFPANIISPNSGQKLVAGSIGLVWTGSDVDNDIIGYDVYLDGVNPPQTIVESDLIQQSVVINSLTSGVYYWKVITKDAAGNTSESNVFEFELE